MRAPRPGRSPPGAARPPPVRRASTSGPLAAPDDVDAADALQLVGGRDQVGVAHLLGARSMPLADLSPEHDQIDRRRRAPSVARAACRPAPARRRARRPSRAARRPRAWPPRPDPRPWRRGRSPAPDQPLPAPRRAPRRRSRAREGATCRRARDVAGDPLGRDHLRRAPGCPSPPGPPQTAGRCAPALRRGTPRARRSPAVPWRCCSPGKESPPPSSTSTEPPRRRGAHQRRIAGDVPQRIAGAAARLECAVNLGGVEDRQLPLRIGSRPSSQRPRAAIATPAASRKMPINRARIGSTISNPALALAIPGRILCGA